MPDSVFTGKIGGQPTWMWVGGAAVLVGGFMWWRKRQAAAAQAASNTAAGITNVPTAATSEELMAAGLYQPPSITYNVPSPNIDNGIHVAAPPTQTPPSPTTQPTTPDWSKYGPAGDLLAQELGMTSASTDFSGLQYWSGIFSDQYSSLQSQHDANAYNDALQNTFDYMHNAAVQQNNTAIPAYSYTDNRGTGAASSRGRSKSRQVARRRPVAVTAAARTGMAPTRSWARTHRSDVVNPLFPNRGYRVA